MAEPTEQPAVAPDGRVPRVACPPAPTNGSVYADDLYCPDCGYSLRGLTSDRCPECGLLLDFIESDTPIIPWERRRELGWFRTYWQTVAQVIFRRKKFCRAFYRPVSYRSAQLFRWVTVLHVFIPALLAAPALYLLKPAILEDVIQTFGVAQLVWWYACLALFLVASTGVASYFFHPRVLSVRQQNRAVALSYYGCAPLAGMALAFVLGGVALALLDAPHNLDVCFAAAACGLALALVILSGNETDEIGKRIFRGKRSGWLFELELGLAWGATALVTLFVLPLVGLYVAIIFYSLRGGGLGG